MDLMRFAPSRLSDGVRRVGFRKWYERELLSSHAHLVLAILAAIAMVASFEAFRGATFAEKILDAVFVLVSGAVTMLSMRRFLFLSMRAEEVANQAVCSDCGSYGRFSVVGEDKNPDETKVCCKKCSHQWTISSG